jgi:uncharacterized protein YndB with AHSA1/START domain
MARVEKQVIVNAPVEQVFSYVADLTKHGEWGQHNVRIEPESEGPMRVGARFRSTSHMMGEKHDTITVTEYDPSQRFSFEAEGQPGRFRHWFTVEQDGGGTRLRKGVETVQAKFPFSLLAPVLFTLAVPRGLQQDLERIRERLEGGGGG